jgi:hypothetical protein
VEKLVDMLWKGISNQHLDIGGSLLKSNKLALSISLTASPFYATTRAQEQPQFVPRDLATFCYIHSSGYSFDSAERISSYPAISSYL